MGAYPSLPSARDLVALMEHAVRGGPEPLNPAGPAWASLVVELVESNLRQWDLEDTTREPGASDAVVAGAKRAIDLLNLARHQLVQEIDTAMDAAFDQAAIAPIATESPGMVLDRLSVLVIRRTRTAAASVEDPACADRVPILDARLTTLTVALDSYLDELRTGRRRFVPYEHFKLYRPAPFPPKNERRGVGTRPD
jgi:Protein of unknown function (DUF4254)